MKHTYSTLIADCEADIRAGQAQHVARRLAELNTSRVPREWRLPLANVCRRANLYGLGMTLLVRVVHPRRDGATSDASAQELAEYSVLLLRSGAHSEALNTLKKVDEASVPEVLLYRAFCHFSLWEFDAAVSGLERYIHSPIQDYAKLVGRVNLAYAYVECRMHDRALELLNQNIAMSEANGHFRLQSNCLSLRAQVHIQNGEFHQARRDLTTAQQLLGTVSTNDGLFITKWSLILDGLEKQNAEPLVRLKALALQNRDWEAAREADFYSLKVDFQRPLFRHLLFGTPFATYRARIASELGHDQDLPYYLFGHSNAPILDLSTGKIDGRPALKSGRKCHQLIDILMRDFYRPVNMGSLFSSLFPGEYFDIFSSPDRVYQILRRTRRWLTENNIPAAIHMARGFYSIQLKGGFGFRVPLEREPVDCMHLHLQKLLGVYSPQHVFSAKTARVNLGMSRRTLQRLLSWGIEQGKIVRLGSSKSETVYRLVG